MFPWLQQKVVFCISLKWPNSHQHRHSECILINGKKICLPLFSPSGLPVFLLLQKQTVWFSPEWELSASLINHLQNLAISISSTVSWYTLAQPLRAILCLQFMSAAAVCSGAHKAQSQYIRFKRSMHARETVNCEAEALSLFLLISEWWVLQLSLEAGSPHCYLRHHWTVIISVQRQLASQTYHCTASATSTHLGKKKVTLHKLLLAIS